MIGAVIVGLALALAPTPSSGTGYRQDEAHRIARFAVEKNRDLEVFFHDKTRKPGSAQARDIARAINSFAQEDPNARRTARIEALVHGAAAVKSLLAEIDKNETTASNAVMVLADRGEKEALEPIRKAVADKRSAEGVRLMGALAIGYVDDAVGAAALTSLLEEGRHPDARAGAALALARLKAPGAAKPLRDLLKKEDAPKTRSWAILALGLLGDADAAGFVMDLAKSKSDSDRRAAALAIGLLAPESGFAALQKLAKDEEDLVRAAAAYALGRFRGRDDAKALLTSLAKDKKDEVRAAAISSLAAIAAPDAGALARKWLGDPQEHETVRRAAAAALGTLGGAGQEGIVALVAALSDGDDAVRGAAAIALARAGDKTAIAEIEKRLGGERKEFVRADWVLALAKLQGREIAPSLEKLPDRDGSPARVLAAGLLPFLAADAAEAAELVDRILAAAMLREGIGADEALLAAVDDELLRAFSLLDKNMEVSRSREGQRSQAPPVKPLQDLRVWFEDRPYCVRGM